MKTMTANQMKKPYLSVTIKYAHGNTTLYGSRSDVESQLRDLKNQCAVREMERKSFNTRENLENHLASCRLEAKTDREIKRFYGEWVNANEPASYQQAMA
jgi:hypothetical protein